MIFFFLKKYYLIFEDNIVFKTNHCHNCYKVSECQFSWCPILKNKINNLFKHSNSCYLSIKECQTCQLLIPLTIFSNNYSCQYYFNEQDPIKKIDKMFFLLGRKYRNDSLYNHCSVCKEPDCILKKYQQQLPKLSINYSVLLDLLYKIIDKQKYKSQIDNLYLLLKKKRLINNL